MRNDPRPPIVTFAGLGGMLVIAVVLTLAGNKPSEVTPSPIPSSGMRTADQTPTRIMEDDPSWNCFADGNHTCGDRKYVPIPEDIQVLLKANEDPDRDWSQCLWSVGDTTYVYCSDGYFNDIS